MARTVGLLFSGFMVRLYGAGMAVWIACEAIAYIRHAFGAVNHAVSAL